MIARDEADINVHARDTDDLRLLDRELGFCGTYSNFV